MDARTKAVKTHRKRLRTRGMKRVEVTVPSKDADLVRQVAAVLRSNGNQAQRLRTTLRRSADRGADPTIAEAMDALPDISGPEFDAFFEEVERARHHPTMMKMRDIDL